MKCSDFALEALPTLLGLQSYCIRYWINPVVKLENLCKKLNFAYAIAHLFCRIGFFCSSPGWWTVPDLAWGTAEWFGSVYKATSHPRDCYPYTNVTRPVIPLRELKNIPSYYIEIFTATNESKGFTLSAGALELVQNLISCFAWIFTTMKGPAMHRQFMLQLHLQKQVAINSSCRHWFWLYLIDGDYNNLLISINSLPFTS